MKKYIWIGVVAIVVYAIVAIVKNGKNDKTVVEDKPKSE